MTEESLQPHDDIWSRLSPFTSARIGLQRTGASITTADLLDFKLAHSRARDAVSERLDEAELARDLAGLNDPVIQIASAAGERMQYLMRPDLGRRLSAEATEQLKSHAGAWDVVFAFADGLSARAVQCHSRPVLAGSVEILRGKGWKIAPFVIVRHGRVAAGDAVAAALGAAAVVILIGERPGLSAADSMGAYLTWRPHAQTTDADRNCISNIRPEGIGYADASRKIAHILLAMRDHGFSGVRLKDNSDQALIGS